jgi:hypothetical protein
VSSQIDNYFSARLILSAPALPKFFTTSLTSPSEILPTIFHFCASSSLSDSQFLFPFQLLHVYFHASEEWKLVVDEVSFPLIFDLTRCQEGILMQLHVVGRIVEEMPRALYITSSFSYVEVYP